MKLVGVSLALCIASLSLAQQAAPPFTQSLLESARAGDDSAQQALAFDYFHGNGTDVDYGQAFFWYSHSAAHGNPGSAYSLGVMYRRALAPIRSKANEQRAACVLFAQAAKEGYTAAFMNVADCYRHGDIGATKKPDIADAAIWYEKSANTGSPTAALALGDLYYNGDGFSKDRSKALFWYERAASAGNLDAKRKYALLHFNDTAGKLSSDDRTPYPMHYDERATGLTR
jgi:TPR repeat protein